MNNIFDIVSFISSVRRGLVKEMKEILSRYQIRIAVEDILLLYYISKNKSDNLSPAKIAEQGQFAIQELIFQIQSLENRSFISLDTNTIEIENRWIRITKPELLKKIFHTVERQFPEEKIRKVLKFLLKDTPSIR